MVTLKAIAEANSQFSASNDNTSLVCVFTGATSGIGAGTLENMAVMMQDSKFYVLGRSASRFATQKAKLERLNPKLKIIFLEAEVSLMSSVDGACKKIVDAEKKIDFLYMSQGCFPINVAQYTKEGLDLCFAIQYYSRNRIVTTLLPLLRASPRGGRILSVLIGGNEKPMILDDLGLENPMNYSYSKAIDHIGTMTTLSLEYLASDPANAKLAFMHSWPALVRTEIFTRLKPAPDASLISRILTAFMARFAFCMQYLLGTSILESGAKQAWILTSERFGPGVCWRVDDKCEENDKPSVLEEYRVAGLREKVWDFTVGMIEKALATGK